MLPRIDIRTRITAVLAWIYVVNVILTDVRVDASTCPGVCFCPSISRIVYCPRKALPFIPTGIPPETVQLNLNDNNFYPIISRANFSRYLDLEQLYLTGCGIEYIEVDTFIDNKRLRWLDIGKNKLKTISDFTFRDLTLDHLFLNDNPGVKISTRAFGGLKLTGLYIQNNAIDKLSLEILRPMNGTLKTLWMDGNKFERLNSEWMYMFRTLSHVRLGENPLHCNCEARWLYDFYTATARMFEGGSPPSCRSPPRLRGKGFKAMQKYDFKCDLPVVKNVDVIFEENVGKMTCLASGDPAPTIYWMKPDGETEVFIPKATGSETISKDMEGVLYVTNPREHRKNRYQCVANNPAGNVTFSINVAWPSVPAYKPVVNQADAAVPNGKDTLSDTNQIEIEEKHEKKPDVKESTKDDGYESNESNSAVAANVAMTQQKGSVQFSVGDIVGAVVGTFLLTLLVCLIVFYIFLRPKNSSPSHFLGQNGHCSSPLDVKMFKGKGPPSRYELDEVEHTIKMLETRNVDIHV